MAEARQLDPTTSGGNLGKGCGAAEFTESAELAELIPSVADVVAVFGPLADVGQEVGKDIMEGAFDNIPLQDDEWLVWKNAGSSVDLAMCQNKQINAVWHVAVASIGGTGHELGDSEALKRLRATIAENTRVKKGCPPVPFVYLSVLRKVATMRSVIEPLHPLFGDSAYEKLLPSAAFGNLYGKIARSGGVLNGLRAGKLHGRVYLYL